MKRRFPIMFVLGAILVVPALTWALPSPDSLPGVDRETDPAKTTRTQLGGALTVLSSGTTVTTPSLADRRIYEFVVSGDWQYGPTSSHRADMAWSTADGWSSATKPAGGRSLMIDGAKQSDTTVSYRADHVYTVSYVGHGAPADLRIFDESYSGNTGSLSVTVWEISKVTWTFTGLVPLPEQLEVGGGSVPPSPIPGVAVSPTTIGGGSGMGVARVRGYRDTFPNTTQPSWCLEITAGNQPPLQVGCSADPARVGPQFDQVITAPVVPQTTVCQSPACSFGGVSPTPNPIGSGIKRGSSLMISFSWTGDDSKLWNYATAHGTAVTQKSNGWAPFDPTKDLPWYTQNLNNLSATMEGCIKDSNGTCGNKQSHSIPGLGQFLEALFHTQVLGI